MISKHQIARGIVFMVYPIVRTLFRPITRRHLAVFLFHEITNTPSDFQLKNSIYTNVENFQKNIKWIHNNYEVVEISQLANLTLKNRKPLAVITFDDAWKGQIWASKYISTKYGLPSTLFLNLGTVKSRIDIAALGSFKQIEVPIFKEHIALPKERELENAEFLDWQGDVMTMTEIEELDQDAKVTFANHSFHHYPAIELTKQEFFENIEINERELSKLNSFRRYFAFPFGRPDIDFNDQHVQMLNSMNYKYIFSAEGKLNLLPLRGQKIISRINFSPSDSKKSDFWWATNKSLLLRRP